jgi:mevalonate pyrophosphate decarboxylase
MQPVLDLQAENEMGGEWGTVPSAPPVAQGSARAASASASASAIRGYQGLFSSSFTPSSGRYSVFSTSSHSLNEDLFCALFQNISNLTRDLIIV